MAKYQLIEFTTINQVETMKKDLSNTCEGYTLFKRHNSRHVSLAFSDENVGLAEVNEAAVKFRDKLIQVAGVGPYGVAIIGVFMRYGSKQRYKPAPHLHWLVHHRQPKQRGGLNNLPAGVMDELKTYWRELAGGSMAMVPAFDAAALIDYFYGDSNALLPRQQWMELPIFNEALLRKRAKRASK